MKLNNLSRLTALLMAVMLCSIPCASASGIDWSDLTGSYLADTDAATALIEAGYCSLCVEEMANVGITAWPATSSVCLHTQLANLSAGEAYDMLYPLYEAKDWLYDAYINAHEAHITTATEEYKREAVICCEGCSEFAGYKVSVPGPSHTQGVCPWYQETLYVPTTPVTTKPDVSTPDTLASLTEVKLTFTATDDTLTYTWQKGTAGADGSIVWDETPLGIGSTYTMPVDAAALAYAYRCVVTDASGNVVSTSSTLYLGGKEFFAWVSSTEGEGAVAIRDWLLLEGNKVEYVLAAYAAYLKGIALSEAIHVATISETVDSTTVTSTVLLELLGLSTLAEIDAAGNVIDVRYHIAVATYKDGVITALPTDDTTATN